MSEINGRETNELEMEEPEIETGPEVGGLVAPASKQSVEDMYFLADNIEKMIAAQNKIRMAVLKLAQPGDWVLFGKDEKKNEAGKAEIGFAGALRIGSTLGVSFTNWEAKRETGRDEIGEWFRWEFECDAIFRGRSIRVYGRAGSRDKFFGKAYGEYKLLQDVDEGNIKVSARRGAMKEGIKCLFGLHHMDPDFLRTNGIKLDSAGGHSFKGQEQSAEDAKAVTVQIESAVLEKSGTTKAGKPWTIYKIVDAEGGVYFTFSATMFNDAVAAVKNKNTVTITYSVDDRGKNKLESLKS